jgi:PPM family protein phosphatase
MNPVRLAKTGEYTPSKAEVPPPRPVSAQVHVDLAALSDPGKVRANNEDHYLVVRFERALETLLTNLPAGQVPRHFAETGYGMCVADGLGGQAAGEVASRVALTTFVNLALHAPDWIMRINDEGAKEFMRRMSERYGMVDAILREQAGEDPTLAGMATTMTLAISVGPDLFLTHIGDSRAYLFRGDTLHQLTRDHTLLQGLIDLGIVRPEDASRHRLKHSLTRALGGGKDPRGPEVQQVALANGDQVLLCTDGLTDMVCAKSITAILLSSKSSDDACRALVETALSNGGLDNVTAVLARYQLPTEPPPPPSV